VKNDSIKKLFLSWMPFSNIYSFSPSSWIWGIQLHKQATFGAPVYSTDIDISPHITQLGCGISCQNLIKPFLQ
jgi:hypothetical protein